MTKKNEYKVLLPALAILLVCVSVFLISSAGANNRDSASPDTGISSADEYGQYRLVIEHRSAVDGSTIMGPYEVYLTMPKGSDATENNQHSLFVEYRFADDSSEIMSPHEVDVPHSEAYRYGAAAPTLAD